MTIFKGVLILAKNALQFCVFVFIYLGITTTLNAETNNQQVRIGVGHSEVLEFKQPVKRISIANPDVADATVTSPSQILVNGKALGSTSLIVWDEGERYTTYKLIVHSEASRNQVMLRVRFAEVNRSALKELGINFWAKRQKIGSEEVTVGSFGGKVSSVVDPFLLPFDKVPDKAKGDFVDEVLTDNVDFFLSIPTQNIATVIRALEEKNLLTTLAKPNLSAINGTEASFLAGGEIPIPIVSGVTNQVTIQYKEFGIRLKFIPTVLDSELVNISVTTEASSLDFDNGIILSGFRIPALITRKTETTVELKDGEHFVIGGLLMNEVAKTVSRVPIIGQIPVLGKLFSSTRFLNNESELIMVIAPHIIPSMREGTIPEIQD